VRTTGAASLDDGADKLLATIRGAIIEGVEGRRFEIGGITGVDIVGIMYWACLVRSHLRPVARILWISSSSAWMRCCAARVTVSVESEAQTMGLVVGTVGIVVSEIAAIVVEAAGVPAIEVAMVEFEAAVCMVLALTGTVQVGLLLAVWTMSELLMAAATIGETVARITLSCSVLTKSALLEMGAAARRMVRITTVGIEGVESMSWFTGICKIHLAAS